MGDENYILETITSVLDSAYTSLCNIRIVENKTDAYNSIVVNSPGTIYRNYEDTGDLLLARLKTTSKRPYIGFNNKHIATFRDVGLCYTILKSDPAFCRVDLNAFITAIQTLPAYSSIMQKIFEDLFNFAPFGCCGRYVQCSDQKKCIHPDLIYALACCYRKHLNAGRIFYGRNRN